MLRRPPPTRRREPGTRPPMACRRARTRGGPIGQLAAGTPGRSGRAMRRLRQHVVRLALADRVVQLVRRGRAGFSGMTTPPAAKQAYCRIRNSGRVPTKKPTRSPGRNACRRISPSAAARACSHHSPKVISRSPNTSATAFGRSWAWRKRLPARFKARTRPRSGAKRHAQPRPTGSRSKPQPARTDRKGLWTPASLPIFFRVSTRGRAV